MAVGQKQRTGKTTEKVDPKDAPHSWVMASNIPVTERQMRYGLMRGAFTLQVRTKVKVIDGYCEHCRKPYDDAADTPCEFFMGQTEHLRGGPIGERKKRKVAHTA